MAKYNFGNFFLKTGLASVYVRLLIILKIQDQ